TRFSRRRRPELPPSSVTVTMAVRSLTGCRRLTGSFRRRVTYSFRPRRSVDRPVPPPNATTLRPRAEPLDLEVRFFTANGVRSFLETRIQEQSANRTIMPGNQLRFVSTGRPIFFG